MANRQHAHAGGSSEAPFSSPPCRRFPFEYSADVPANTDKSDPHTVKREVPFDGFVTQLVVGWPDGANNRVGIQFRRSSGERIFPRNKEDDYIAQNDFQHPYDVCVPIEEEETLVAEFINVDSTEHFVNVIPTFQEGGV